MELYTLILDYKGGTYITQARSPTPDEAIFCCLRSYDDSGLDFDKEAIIRALQEDDEFDMKLGCGDNLIAIEGVQHVWTRGALLNDEMAELLMILTKEHV